MFNKIFNSSFFKKGFFKISFLIFVFSFFINTNITKANTFCDYISTQVNCYSYNSNFVLPNDAVLTYYECDRFIERNSVKTGCSDIFFKYSFNNNVDEYVEYCSAD